MNDDNKVHLDFNKPIMHNRPENIAIKFYGCIKNSCEAIFTSMLANDFGYWLKRYPGIQFVKECHSKREIYYRMMAFTPKEFLKNIREPYPPLTEHEITEDLSNLLGKLADPMRCSFTSLEIALREIAKYDFCKKVIIYDTALGSSTKDYITKLMQGIPGKAFMYTGFFKELISHDEASTYFVDDVEDLMDVLETYEFEKREKELEGKQFFIQGLNATDGTNKDGTIRYKYHEYIRDVPKRFNADVMWITSHYIDLGNPDPVVDTGIPEDEVIKKHQN